MTAIIMVLLSLKKGSRSMGDMIRTLILIYEVMTPEEMKGTVEYL
ncbi:hypothetical protein [Crocosphaera watsonii]|nr:hypothetical protein [Crocosphaera watsonii]